MDLFNLMNKVNKIGKYFIISVIVMNLIGFGFATVGAEGGLQSGLSALCVLSQTLLGVMVMVMIVLAGATYAIGQLLGAETRARASVWATAMLTGAVVGAVIYIIAPYILATILGSTVGENPCDFAIKP